MVEDSKCSARFIIYPLRIGLECLDVLTGSLGSLRRFCRGVGGLGDTGARRRCHGLMLLRSNVGASEEKKVCEQKQVFHRKVL